MINILSIVAMVLFFISIYTWQIAEEKYEYPEKEILKYISKNKEIVKTLEDATKWYIIDSVITILAALVVLYGEYLQNNIKMVLFVMFIIGAWSGELLTWVGRYERITQIKEWGDET